MRSAGAGLFGALLMVAPLVAIPILAVVGVPQFAPTVSALEGSRNAGADEFDDYEEFDDFESRPARSRSGSSSGRRVAKRRTADDLYAPLAEPLEALSSDEPAAAQRWESEVSDVEALPDLRTPADFGESNLDEEPAPAFSGRRRSEAPVTRLPPARRAASGGAPRGSLGDWEIDERTGSPRPDTAELAGQPRAPRVRANTGEFELADDPGEEEPDLTGEEGPLSEEGAINFLARNRQPESAPPARSATHDLTRNRERTGPTAPARSAPRGSVRPIPTDDLGDALPMRADPAETEIAMSDFDGELDDEGDPLSEVELQRGLAIDPLSSRSPARSAPARGSIGASPLDFPEPAPEDFQGATPLGEASRKTAALDTADTGLAELDPTEPEGAESDFEPNDLMDKMESSRSGSVARGQSPADPALLESLTWTQATAQLKKWGIRKYRLEADPETEGFIFVCMAPDPNSTKVARRFETTGADPLSAVRAALGEISEWYASRTRRGGAAP